MKVRAAMSSDEAALRALWQHFMIEMRGGLAPTTDDTESWEKRLHSQLGRNQVLVAKDARGIQGFCGFIDHADRSFVPPGIAFLVDLYVAPAVRGQSLGVTLLRHLVERAAGEGYAGVWTNTDESNRPARRCFTRAGFGVLHGFELPGLTGQRYYRFDMKQTAVE